MANTDSKKNVVMHTRTRAYVDFLKTCFDTDLDGLADIIGSDGGKIRRYYTENVGECEAETLYHLAKLSGVSLDFLLAGDFSETAPDRKRRA